MPGGARHSEELKLKVVQCHQEGLSYGEVAKRFLMSKSSVVAIVKKFSERNSVENIHAGKIYIII